jgi:hypothetical protein
MNLDSKRQAVTTDQRNLGLRVGALSGAVLRILIEIPLLNFATELRRALGPLGEYRELPPDLDLASRPLPAALGIFTLLLVSGFAGLLAGGFGGRTCRPLVGALLRGFISAAIRSTFLYALVAGAVSLATSSRLPPFDGTPPVVLVSVAFAGAIAGGFGAFVGRGRRCDMVT